MPISFDVLPPRELVVASCTGDLTVNVVRDYFYRLLRDPHHNADYAHLFVTEDVVNCPISYEDVRSLAGITPFSVTARRAFVVATPLLYGMARMYLAHLPSLHPDRYEVFCNVAAAEKWLDEQGRPSLAIP